MFHPLQFAAYTKTRGLPYGWSSLSEKTERSSYVSRLLSPKKIGQLIYGDQKEDLNYFMSGAASTTSDTA